MEISPSDITFGSLTEPELQQWFDHVASVFPQAGRDYFVRHYLEDPRTDIHAIFVARHGQKIVSTVRVFTRKIYLRGHVVDAGGIGEVSTNPDYRSRGLASKLLDMAVKYCRDKKWPIMQLHTGKQAPFYASLGWMEVPVHNNTLICHIHPNGSHKENSRFRVISVDPAKNQAACHDMMQLHDMFCRLTKVTGPMERSDGAYWQRWIAPEVFRRGANGIKALFGYHDDKIRAYMVSAFSTNTNGDYELKVQEYCGPSTETFFELISESIRASSAPSADRVSIIVPANLTRLFELDATDVIYCSTCSFTISEIVKGEFMGTMYKILDPSAIACVLKVQDKEKDKIEAAFSAAIMETHCFFAPDGY